MRLFLLIICLLGFMTTSFANEMTATSIQLKGKTPQGTIIEKNKVTLKKGYFFEKKSATKVLARMRRGNGITGEFDCTCNGEQGGCSAVTTPNSVTCASSGCSSCYMIVTIPDKKAIMMH